MGAQDKKHQSIPIPAPPPPYSIENKSHPPPAYTFANMYSTPHYASAAHVPPASPSGVNPGLFNVWGITGYTGSIETSSAATPEQAACHLAKMQQAMNGYTNFDPFKFSKPVTISASTDDDKPKSDNKKDDSDDESKHSSDSYSFRYRPAYPGYGHHYGIPPPPCPPKKEEKKKSTKCIRCEGISGHPVKKIKKLKNELLCWSCVWEMYSYEATKVWEESEDVDM